MASVRALLDLLPDLATDDFTQFGETSVVPLGKWQKIGGRFLARNWVSIPHVTHHDSLDVSTLDARRQEWNAQHQDQKRTLLPYLVLACAQLLRTHTKLNCSLDEKGENVILKRYFHIGVAVDAPNGLLVPVVRDCDRKAIDTIAAEVKALSDKASGSGLSMKEMSGGCFTISSLGHIGGTGFTPIINAPEVAILGVCRTYSELHMDHADQLRTRTMLPVSLSYDHRVLNGVDAARFVRDLGETLASLDFQRSLQ